MSAVAGVALAGDEGQRLQDEFAISQAAEFARAGAFARAEDLLRPLVSLPGTVVDALDLQARICAQQGRVVEAERAWMTVLERDPANAQARAGLRRLRRSARRSPWISLVGRGMGGAGILGAVLLTAVGLRGFDWGVKPTNTSESRLIKWQTEKVQRLSTDKMRIEDRLATLSDAVKTGIHGAGDGLADPAAPASNRDDARDAAKNSAAAIVAIERSTRLAARHQLVLRSEVAHARADLNRLASEYHSMVAAWRDQLSRSSGVPLLVLSVPGVVTRAENGQVVVSFEAPLFDGAQLSHDGAGTLRQVARVLAMFHDPLRVIAVTPVNSHSGPVELDSSRATELAMKRLTVVVDELMRAGLRPDAIDVGTQATVAGSSTVPPAVESFELRVALAPETDAGAATPRDSPNVVHHW